MKPDVVIVTCDHTVVFRPQHRLVSEWLHRRCSLAAENISGDTEIRVHPRKFQSIIAELRAMGFIIVDESGETY